MINGIIPAVLTPFTIEGRINEASLRKYVDFLIEKGVHGLFPLGTNGLGPLLSADERSLAARIIVEQTDHRVPVIIHTGSISTEESIQLTKEAEKMGADAAAVVAPWYFPHDDASLEMHFSAVAEAAPDLPLYLYNIPSNAKNDLKPSLVKKLAMRHSNIKGVKDSSKDLTKLQEYVAALGPGYKVVVGTDALVVPAMLMGASGVVTAVGNCFPEVMVELYHAYRSGNIEKAKSAQYKAIKVRDALKVGPYITPYMEALKLRGLDIGYVKSPIRAMTNEEKSELSLNLLKLGLI